MGEKEAAEIVNEGKYIYNPLTIDDARITGLSFELSDHRQHYDTTLSFLRLACASKAELDGQLVECHFRDKYRGGIWNKIADRDEAYTNCEVVLDKPGIHLRYAYEKALDMLLLTRP